MNCGSHTHSIPAFQFSVKGILVATTATAIILSIGVAAGISPVALCVAASILAVRYFVVFKSRLVIFSLPLLLLLIGLPVLTEWGSLQHAWFATMRPDPRSDWILWFIAYPAVPVIAWLIDITQGYDSMRSKVVRCAYELFLIFVWMFISVAILVDMRSTHS